MHMRFNSLAFLAGVLILAPVLAASAHAQAHEDERPGASIQQVEARYVCMVNDRLFSQPQIPVPVGEKTYYGCCQGCVSTLTHDSESRTATDPITGKQVDKATAVIGALPDGTVRYFESEKTLRQYEVLTT